VEVLNPAWRTLEKALKDPSRRIRKLHAQLGAATRQNDGGAMQARTERLQDIQRLAADPADWRSQRRNTPKKVTRASLPENQRPRPLAPLGTMLADTLQRIACRAETARVGLLRPHWAKEEEARALGRALFVSSADREPNEQENTLTVRIQRRACPAHDQASGALLAELNQLAFHHPETNARLIYELASDAQKRQIVFHRDQKV
jgi:hypothetical protein